MALGFLGDFNPSASGGMNSITPFLQGISSIVDMFRPSASDKAYKQALALQQEPAALYRAIMDPDNPMLKRMTTDNTQAGINALLMQLKQQQMMDVRRGGRGLRGTFYNPERADETINYLLTRGAPAIQENARLEAKNTMLGSAQGLNQVNPMTGSMITARGAVQDASGGLSNKLGQLSKGIQQLTNIFNPQQDGIQNTPQLPWFQQVQSGQLKPNSYTYYG